MSVSPWQYKPHLASCESHIAGDVVDITRACAEATDMTVLVSGIEAPTELAVMLARRYETRVCGKCKIPSYPPRPFGELDRSWVTEGDMDVCPECAWMEGA